MIAAAASVPTSDEKHSVLRSPKVPKSTQKYPKVPKSIQKFPKVGFPKVPKSTPGTLGYFWTSDDSGRRRSPAADAILHVTKIFVTSIRLGRQRRTPLLESRTFLAIKNDRQAPGFGDQK